MDRAGEAARGLNFSGHVVGLADRVVQEMTAAGTREVNGLHLRDETDEVLSEKRNWDQGRGITLRVALSNFLSPCHVVCARMALDFPDLHIQNLLYRSVRLNTPSELLVESILCWW